MRHGLFVFTSNVDRQFQWAGVPEERVVEIHFVIAFFHCIERCGQSFDNARQTDTKV